MSTRESGTPQSPLPPRSPRPSDAQTWEQTIEALDQRIDNRKDEARANALAIKENATGITALRGEIGRPPNVVTGDRGSGMWGAIGAMMDRLSHVDATTTQILGRVTAIESGSSTRKGWLVSRGERVLDALLVAAFLTIAATAVKKLGLW